MFHMQLIVIRNNKNYGNMSFNKSNYGDSIYIKNDKSDWKNEIIIDKVKNPIRINSKYSAVVNGAYQTTTAWSLKMGDRSSSQQSFYRSNSKSILDRPNTSSDNYGSQSRDSLHQSRNINQTYNFDKRTQSSLREKMNRSVLNKYSFDKVRNYKSKAFKDSQPVYGAIDAFNRKILKNAHEDGSGSKSNSKIALRPLSKISRQETESIGSSLSYKTLMKKPRERVNNQIQQMINFRRSFYRPKIVFK